MWKVIGGSACNYILSSMTIFQGGITCDKGHVYHSRRIGINWMEA